MLGGTNGNDRNVQLQGKRSKTLNILSDDTCAPTSELPNKIRFVTNRRLAAAVESRAKVDLVAVVLPRSKK